MEEINTQNKDINSTPSSVVVEKNKSQSQMAGAIIIAGLLIAGAILLKGNGTGSTTPINRPSLEAIALSPVTTADRALGNPDAKLSLVLYEDFQCPFCGKFFKEVEDSIRNTYVQNGSVQLVYRDYAFLGPESTRAAEAALCATDQGKFWEFHDYLFTHQNGENKGNFSDLRLKSFARDAGLDTVAFNQCFTSNKYAQAVANSATEAGRAGVSGTPKGFIVTKKDISSKTQDEIMKAINQPPNSQPAISFYTTKNIVSLNGALPYSMVKAILDILLK